VILRSQYFFRACSRLGPTRNIQLLLIHLLNYYFIYTFAVVFYVIVAAIKSFSFLRYVTTASLNLHNRLFRTVIRAPMWFFDVYVLFYFIFFFSFSIFSFSVFFLLSFVLLCGSLTCTYYYFIFSFFFLLLLWISTIVCLELSFVLLCGSLMCTFYFIPFFLYFSTIFFYSFLFAASLNRLLFYCHSCSYVVL
jgi:hypothetical protein